ncbi:MAG: VOC family protein, partial [Bacillota bacterium]
MAASSPRVSDGGRMAIIEGMNHFNVLTDDVDKTRAFYVGVLGLTEGDR